MSDFRRRLLKKTVKNIYADDGCVTFFGVRLGYSSDSTFPEGLNFALYAVTSSDEFFYVGNFSRLLVDEDGNYWIPNGATIGRWQSSLNGFNGIQWRLYSDRNIGNTVYYYNVPVYSRETGDLLYEANYDEADYY